MKTAQDLRRAIRAIDRRGYPACKALKGAYRFDSFILVIDHVQGDPFAAPSSLHVEVAHKEAGFPHALRAARCQRIALADYLTRQFAAALDRASFKAKGSGKSGLLATTRCGQEVLERSACDVGADAIVARFHAGFPAFGRSVNAEGLELMLLDLLPRCVERALLYRSLNAERVAQAVHLAEDQEALRGMLREEGLVAFVADGAVLPRESGVSDRPLRGAVPFASPETLRRTFELPHAGAVSGMAVERGVTLIVGGGYHGKSTLLGALQAGVYNHVAGDGREFVLADDTAVKLRAEDGRAVRDVDIALFVNDLPNGADTTSFSTLDASGSTSQAAAVVEGLEAGARLFLVDEDTSATNFMVRDALMQKVVVRDKEPITPFVERVRDLYEQAGVSTVLVAGSSGAFFAVADRVIQMDCYRAFDITDRVREVCAEFTADVAAGAGDVAGAGVAARADAGAAGFAADVAASASAPRPFRMPRFDRAVPSLRGAADARGGRHQGRQSRGGRERMKVKARGRDTVTLGRTDVDVRYLEQIADAEQTTALAYLMRHVLEDAAGGTRTIAEAMRLAGALLDERGWQPFCGSYVPCGLARPRSQELAATLNRLRA